MAEQPPAFVVVDKRKFTAEGDVREQTPEQHAEQARDAAARSREVTPEPATEKPEAAKVVTMPARHAETDPLIAAADDLGDEDLAGSLEDGQNDNPAEEEDLGEPRSAAETAAQDAAYRESSRELDSMLKQANPGMQTPGVVSFEHVIQSFYLSAIMAMGAGTQPGEKPRIDILGARQSIDMLAVLEEKTRGNLTPAETQLLQGITFELRMMFLELTNAISKQAHAPGAPVPPGGLR